MLTSIIVAGLVSIGGLDLSSGITEERSLHTQPQSVNFTVVIMDSFGDQRIRGAVRRTVGSGAQDLVIIKRSELSPEFLTFLARALAASVARKGSTLTAPINMYYLRPHSHSLLSAAERLWATTLIVQLRSASTKNFGRLGSQQALSTTFISG